MEEMEEFGRHRHDTTITIHIFIISFVELFFVQPLTPLPNGRLLSTAFPLILKQNVAFVYRIQEETRQTL
jgi:hypothetical protein